MTFKSALRKIVTSPFTIRPFDSLLAKMVTNLPDTHFARKLIPDNKQFRKNTLRICKRSGIKFLLDLNDYQAWLIYFSFQKDSAEAILTYIKDEYVVIDVGGNIGQTALVMANKVGSKGKVISFEPYPDTFSKFLQNIKLNGHIKNIHSVKLGLGENTGQFEMYQDCTTNSGANRIAPQLHNELVGSTMISVTTLDAFLNANPLDKIDLIKIDVEGFEMKVLNGATNTIAKHRPAIYMEVDDNNLRKQGNNIEEIFAYLEKYEYSFIDIETGNKIEHFMDLANKHTDIYCYVNE